MSLSKFYQSNTDFQPKAILEQSTPSSTEPVWESIVKDTVESSTIPDESIPVQKAEPPKAAEPAESVELAQPIEPIEPIEPIDALEADANEGESNLDDESIPEDNRLTEEPIPEEIITEPPIDVEAIRETAFTSGIIAGRQQAEEDFENSARTLISICNELDRLRETILQNSVVEMKEMVLAISEVIIRHSLTEQEETIVATIKDSIQLAVKSDEFIIRINPQDLEAVENRKKELLNSMSGLVHIVLKTDSTIEKGGCTLESTACTIDARLASQIKGIHDSIMAPETLTKPDNTEEALSS